jgi:hypothetical protein
VGDDYFNTGGAPTGWTHQAEPAALAGSQASRRQASSAAVGIVVSGALMCVGAIAPWLHAAADGETFHYSGMHSQLDGRWVLGLGVVVVVLGVLLAAVPQAREARAALCAACVVVGIVGLVVVIHQHDVLSSRFRLVNDLLGAYLQIHIGAGWGLWLAGLGCVGASAAGGLAYVM